ncbi:MAG: hypothetical protein ABUL60_34805 [Myxococcales bacterium]
MWSKLRTFLRHPRVVRVLAVARTALLVASLLLGSYWLAARVEHFYPIKSWLVWRYLAYWGGAAFFALSCQLGGLPIVSRLGRDFRWSERVLLAQAVGTVLFFLGMFVLGMLGLFHRAVFFAWPLALIGWGSRAGFRQFRRLRRLRRVAHRMPRVALSVPHLAAIGLGLVSLVVLYSQIIHPEQVSYDARWYHLSVAEQYAATGRILRYTDWSYVNAYPQLTSVLYTWAFLSPAPELFDKVELCAHMVFLLFCGILAGVGLLTRRLVRPASLTAWSSVFLFPGLFLYDSGLHLGADHTAAFFAAPLALTALVAFKSWRTPNWLLLATMIAGCTLTKYSVAALFAVPALALVLRALWGIWKSRRQRPLDWLVPPAWGLLAVLLLTAPHWAKNWVFYGNPLYPYAAGIFKHQPWGDYNRRIFELFSATHEWAPHGSLKHRLDETIHAVPFFAFEVHDWPAFHRDVPVFGFLFSLSGLALPFVRGRTRRLWVGFLACYVGLFLWYWGMHQDRYLQVLLPWMAAATAATLALAWRSSAWAKLPVALLILLQLAWGADVPFLPGHAMLGRPPTALAIELASSGYRGQVEGRLDVFEPYQKIGKSLDPRSARVLLHEHHMSLGLRVMTLQDFAHTTGRFDYGAQPSFGAVERMLRSAGVTHVVWVPRQSLGWSGYAGDFVFFDFLRGHLGTAQSFGSFNLAPLQGGADLDLRSAQVAYLGCQGGYRQGVYSLSSMNFPDIISANPKKFPKPEQPLADPSGLEAQLHTVRYVVFDPGCGGKAPRALRNFTLLANRSTVQLWARSDDAMHD